MLDFGIEKYLFQNRNEEIRGYPGYRLESPLVVSRSPSAEVKEYPFSMVFIPNIDSKISSSILFPLYRTKGT